MRHSGGPAGLDPFWCQKVGIVDFVMALAKVAGLDETFVQQAPENVIDLPQADSGMPSKLALVSDRLPVQGVEDFEGFLRKLHRNPSPQSRKDPESLFNFEQSI